MRRVRVQLDRKEAEPSNLFTEPWTPVASAGCRASWGAGRLDPPKVPAPIPDH